MNNDDGDFNTLALIAELTSSCWFCGLLGRPMSLVMDCIRGQSDEVGIDMRGDGWRLMLAGDEMTVYCGYCARIDESCHNVPLESWHHEEIERKAAANGWAAGAMIGRSTVFDYLAVYTVSPAPRSQGTMNE